MNGGFVACAHLLLMRKAQLQGHALNCRPRQSAPSVLTSQTFRAADTQTRAKGMHLLASSSNNLVARDIAFPERLPWIQCGSLLRHAGDVSVLTERATLRLLITGKRFNAMPSSMRSPGIPCLCATARCAEQRGNGAFLSAELHPWCHARRSGESRSARRQGRCFWQRERYRVE